jgi:DNA-binding transcriptional LysR family regulator
VLLVELGRHGSILHAAQAANLTQPAASKLLGELEHVLGVPLFERLPRGVVPTHYGEVLVRRAGSALAEMDAAHQEIMELLSGLSGRVAVGTVMTPSVSLLPETVKLLKSRYSKVHVSISVDTSKVLINRLRAGELDMVIGRILDTESANELNFEPLSDEPHSLIARADHPLANNPDLRLENLLQEGWIMPPTGSILRDRLTALFLSQGLDQPAETVETTALPMITNLLIGSDMVAALPEELVRPYLDIGLLIVLPYDLGLRMDWYGIVTRKQHKLSPGAQAMLTTLRDVAASHYG